MRKLFLPLVILLMIPSLVQASSGEIFYQTTWLILAVYAAAKLLGGLCSRMGIPSLVGEILGGMVLGNLYLVGVDYPITSTLIDSQFFNYAAELGVIFLLFLVGLESNLKTLVKSGFNATVTACIGVILPTLGGFFLAKLFNLGNTLEALLVGATFAATSVGITAKVLAESKKLQAPSSQIILGAAVIDDVLGLILLAALAGIASTGEFAIGSLGVILLKIAVFFALAIFVGHFILPQTFKIYRYVDQPGLMTIFAVMLALLFANVATLAGLAPIIGAFTAGLLLDEVRLKHAPGLSVKGMEEVIKPIVDFLLPIFFVSIGVQIKILSLFNINNFLIIISLTLAALVGKALCGFCCKGKNIDRIGIGLGMIPRGEVGLIFVAFGLQAKIIGQDVYSLLVFVVLLTTLIGPILLKTRLNKF